MAHPPSLLPLLRWGQFLSPLPAPKAQDVENIHFLKLGGTVTILGDDSMLSVQTLLATFVDVSSREELDVLLECFTTFTNMEPLASHMNKLFPIL